MIYLGGSFKTDYDTFAQEADFWGHGMSYPTGNVMKLNDMIMGLEDAWHESVTVHAVRRDFRVYRY